MEYIKKVMRRFLKRELPLVDINLYWRTMLKRTFKKEGIRVKFKSLLFRSRPEYRKS